ncbi:uncharacterized protein LOC132705438 [Cylas formicarius]|uniref:uncharacterized protein LOC132704131 n=1 Tax=Cylas formicarius TaxID=197179 RepID=UPI00295846FE|nr:uncharacterized protein LOC132704131 [Cylas formicarius]XP_060529930.1 uncharacterized protein LOC132704131 [Cylas formicarius]XP_060532012.1 uncharacterized protein LOC132705438 [Cylas formicarius]
MVSEESQTLIKQPDDVDITSDWNYFLTHHDSEIHKIPHYFDLKQWTPNNVYRARVSHVFSPSHFWIVTLERELDCFHMYLHNFYTKNKDHYRVPISHIKKGMYSVAYTEGSYYRGRITNVPHQMCNKTWAFVYLLDFGYMAKVGLDDIYFFTKKLYRVPQFAIRATLAGIGPLNLINWSPEVVAHFCQLANARKILMVQIRQIDSINKTLIVRLAEYNYDTLQVEDVINQLVVDNMAKQLTMIDLKELKHLAKRRRAMGSRTKIKFRFLCPSFDDIEYAKFPDALVAIDYLRKMQDDSLFRDLTLKN